MASCLVSAASWLGEMMCIVPMDMAYVLSAGVAFCTCPSWLQHTWASCKILDWYAALTGSWQKGSLILSLFLQSTAMLVSQSQC